VWSVYRPGSELDGPGVEPCLASTQSHKQWVPIKWHRREVNHSLLSSVKAKDEWSSTSTPPAGLYCMERES
jgi:hypothetical protein